jgi:hypothetical protein
MAVSAVQTLLLMVAQSGKAQKTSEKSIITCSSYCDRRPSRWRRAQGSEAAAQGE